MILPFSPLITELPEECQDFVKEVNFQERFKTKECKFTLLSLMLKHYDIVMDNNLRIECTVQLATLQMTERKSDKIINL